LGRYDAVHNWIGFPDEGVRFYFNDDYSWITLRPSGNQQAHRFYAQLRFPGVTRDDILAKKKEGHLLIREMVKDLRRIVGA
jgi:phosphomannomutase